MRVTHRIRLPRGELVAGPKTLLMGIINSTPDSFYRGSSHPGHEEAISFGLQFVQEGADILDVGGESTRPGAEAVDADEEMARILPVIEALAQTTPVPISVDTYRSEVARAALEAGAQLVNDISGFRFDPGMADVVGEFGAAVVLSHIRGTPDSMHRLPPSPDIVGEVVDGLNESIRQARNAGIDADRILVDPGIGFGKNGEENLRLINQLERIVQLGYPVLMGVSRKRFIGRILGQEQPEERLVGTAAAVACCILRGACVVRVHDVAAMRQAAQVADAIDNERIFF